MGSANFTCPLVIQSPGNVIYSAEMNAEFQNIATNFNPAGMSGYQDSLAQKQLQEDPATGLVTSLAKEVEQLRFAVARIIGETYWFTTPDNDLNGTILKSGVAGDVSLGDGTKTTTTPLLTLNANTGDAGVRLQVNNTSANAWDIYNDNSDSDNIKMDYNGTTKYVGSSSGAAEHKGSDDSSAILLTVNNAGTSDAGIRLKVNNDNANAWDVYNDNSDSDKLKFDYAGNERFIFVPAAASPQLAFNNQNIATSTAPTFNTIYPHSIVKAWGVITSTGSGTSLTITEGFNVSSAVYDTGLDYITITLHTAMGNANYCVVTTEAAIPASSLLTSTVNISSTEFRIFVRTSADGAAYDFNSASGRKVNFIVVGAQ